MAIVVWFLAFLTAEILSGIPGIIQLLFILTIVSILRKNNLIKSEGVMVESRCFF